MAKLLKLRRGTTSQHSSFTGAEGEVTVDTTKDTIVVHDGSTAGGTALAKESDNLSLIDEDNLSTNSATRPPSQQSVKAYVDALPDVIDEDNLGSDSATRPPSQQSVKAYVDALPDVIDEDNFATNSATRPPSQQSAKAYVDAADATKAPLANPTFTGTVNAAALTLSGNLQVNGTTTTVASSTMTVADKNIEIAKGAANDAAADGAGITIDSGDGDKTWNWVNSTDAWTSSEHIHLGDGKQLLLGTGSDLKIHHTSGNSYIEDAGTGGLVILSDGTLIETKFGTEHAIKCTKDGSVDLYYNNVKTFNTEANGVKILGGEGEYAYLYMYADEGDDNNDKWRVEVGNGNAYKIATYAGGSWLNALSLNSLGDATFVGNATFAGAVSDSKGNLRSIPANVKSSSYTLISSDAGKHISTTAAVTIPPSVFSIGDAVTIYNDSSSAIALTRGSGVTMFNSADATNADRSLAGRGLATLMMVGTNHFVISGAGLS